MPYELLAQYLKLPIFALVVSRLGGMILFQPILGSLSVPVNLRVLLVVGLAALVTPVVDWKGTAPDTGAGLALAMGGELLIGLCIGLMLHACFMGFQLGGLLIAQESGLALGQIADPTFGEEESVLSGFYLQVAAAVYLILGAHRALLAACLDTFHGIPLLGDGGVSKTATDLVCDALAVGAEVGVRIAAPTVLTLFLANVALGFLSRTVPQINITTLGFSLKTLVAFVLMAASLPTAVTAFAGALEQVTGWVQRLASP